MVTCLGRGADLYMARLMPLLLTISCASKSRLVFFFWCRLTRVVLELQYMVLSTYPLSCWKAIWVSRKIRLELRPQLRTYENFAIVCWPLQCTHPFYGPLDFVRDYLGEPVPEPVCILVKQETVSGSSIICAICNFAPRHGLITMPAPCHSVFYRLDALLGAQTTASKHWRQSVDHYKCY